ncbi:hypothetical protein [Agrobacterium rubi]|nr:hypothetical protein [Agrobacterium rubi]
MDEAEDVAGSIRHVLRAATFVNDDPLTWKWVVLTLHSALQGACVCHLTTTTAPVGAVTERNASEWLTYFEASPTNPNLRPPKTHLKGLPDLLLAVRSSNSACDNSYTAGVEISESELNWLGHFHKNMRNQFVHFEPMGWSIEVSGIPEIAKVVARIIGEILQIKWASRHQDTVQREEMQRNLRVLASIEWPV